MPDGWTPEAGGTPACPVCGWVYGNPIPDEGAVVDVEACSEDGDADSSEDGLESSNNPTHADPGLAVVQGEGEQAEDSADDGDTETEQ